MEIARGLRLSPSNASCLAGKPSVRSTVHFMRPRMSSSLQLESGVTVLHGLGSLVDSMRYKVWLLDQFGVLHDGQKPYPGAIETLHKIASSGAKLVILSNSSRRAASTYERMESLGFDASLFTGIITSGELTHDYLLQRKDPWFAALGDKCLHITWSARSAISLEGLGLKFVEDPELADFLLVHGTEAWGLSDGGIKPATLSELETVLSLAAQRGLPMVVANPDHVTVEARYLMIMPGSLGLQYEKLGGYVRYMGKPDTVVYEAVMQMTGFKSCDMLAVGDSLFHDIQGAARNQIDSVFVAGGIHADELGISNIGDQPNLDHLQSLFKTEGFYPTYVIPMFSWHATLRKTEMSLVSSADQARFAVFLTGHSSSFTQEKYGGYGQLCVNLLQESGEAWDIIPVVDGVLPTSGDLDQYDGFVITGSKYDAHGNDPWILHLCDILRELHLKGKKVLGLCFGHQILCRALGGKTGRAPVGWELGARAVQLSLDAFSSKPYARDMPDVLRIIESHQDQAFEIPPGAEILGYSTRTPIEVFALGNHILGIQGHPEFEVDIVLDIIETRMALGVISEDVANNAKASIVENKPDNYAWQKLCKDFLKSRTISTL